MRILLVGFMMFLALATSAQKISDRGSDKIKLGIAGYTFHATNLDKSIEMCQKAGVKYLSVKSFHLPYNSTKAEMDVFKKKLEDAGIDGYTLGPIYMKSKEDVDNTFEYVKRYGVDMFIGVPTYDLLPYVEEMVKKYNIKIALHNHGPDSQPFPDAEDIMNRIKDMDARIGICFDMGHTYRYGSDCVSHIKKYHKRIFDVHYKDVTAASKQGHCIESGRGELDIPAIMKAFEKVGYEGVISLEYEKDSRAPYAGIVESLGYMRGVCDCIYK